MCTIQTVSELYDALGRDAIRKTGGHGHQVMSRALTEDTLPSHWFPQIKGMCEAEGIPVPEHLFRFNKVARRRTGERASA